ncbi:MAG: hypothetical protein WC205_04125 [Opitutaceae bacterium]
MSWREDDVMRWLNDNPLPKDLTFRGEIVWPRKVLKKGYGFWLKTSGPYHPALRGLYNLVVQIIQAIPVGKPMPTPEQLADKIRAHEAAQGVLVFTAEDNAPAEPVNPALEPGDPKPADGYNGQGVDFARKNRERAEAAQKAGTASKETNDEDIPF